MKRTISFMMAVLMCCGLLFSALPAQAADSPVISDELAQKIEAMEGDARISVAITRKDIDNAITLPLIAQESGLDAATIEKVLNATATAEESMQYYAAKRSVLKRLYGEYNREFLAACLPDLPSDCLYYVAATWGTVWAKLTKAEILRLADEDQVITMEYIDPREAEAEAAATRAQASAEAAENAAQEARAKAEQAAAFADADRDRVEEVESAADQAGFYAEQARAAAEKAMAAARINDAPAAEAAAKEADDAAGLAEATRQIAFALFEVAEFNVAFTKQNALIEVIEYAKMLHKDRFTWESFSAVNSAITEAESVLAANDTEKFDAAREALNRAINALQERPGFDDVKAPSKYYYKPVYWAVEQGITTGTTKKMFSPDVGCTRAQAVTFLWRALGEPEPESDNNPFRDIEEKVYYYKAVLWAVERGITTGTSQDAFSPNQICTRAQIVTFLWRLMGSVEPETSVNPFADVADDAYYAKAVRYAESFHITKGTSADRFSPDATCTRGQIVTFLYRFFHPYEEILNGQNDVR